MDVFSREVRRAFARPCRPGGPPRCGPSPKLWLSEFTIQSEQSSATFDLNVSKPEQARWLRAAYEISDQLRAVAGLGWLQLLNQPEGPRSANWGLMTSAGFPKPAFYAYRDAPSRRHRPSVAAPRLVRVGAKRRGVVVVRPAVTGKVVVLLRERSGFVLRRWKREVEAESRARFGLTPLRRGRYRIVVDAARGERVIRPLRVR